MMKHLKEIDSTYWSHLKFAWGEAIRCEVMSVILFVHGIVPCLFHDRFSKYVSEAQNIINKFQHKTPAAWGDSTTTTNME